jgi:hypothetical protein
VTSLRLSPSTVVGGSTSDGHRHAVARRAARRRVVAISSSKPAVAEPPATVAVAAGQLSASFAISTTAVSAADVGGYLSLVQRRHAQDRNVDRHTSRNVLAHAEPVDGRGRRERHRHGDALRTRSVGRDRRDAHQLAPISGRRAAQRDGRGGTRSATFSVTTIPVTADTTAWISGTYRGGTKGATLSIKR